MEVTMKKVLRLLSLVILVLGIAASASAQLAPAPEPLYQTYDEYASYSGTFYYCAAKGSWGGSCIDCVKVDGIYRCGEVRNNAACTCQTPCQTKGKCTYE
jgi:hypothetical protein